MSARRPRNDGEAIVGHNRNAARTGTDVQGARCAAGSALEAIARQHRVTLSGTKGEIVDRLAPFSEQLEEPAADAWRQAMARNTAGGPATGERMWIVIPAIEAAERVTAPPVTRPG